MYYVFATILILCLAVQVYEDLKDGYLFDEVSLALGVTGLGYSVYKSQWLDALYGMVFCGCVMGLLYYATQGGMGLGDVFLSVAIAPWLGFMPSVEMLLLAFIYGGMVAVVLLLLGRGRKHAIPFGPFLALGTLTAFFYGERILYWYFQVVKQ